MYNLIKKYCNLYERHTIACLVYLFFSLIAMLCLLFFPNMIVNAEESTEPDTSILTGVETDNSAWFSGYMSYNDILWNSSPIMGKSFWDIGDFNRYTTEYSTSCYAYDLVHCTEICNRDDMDYHGNKEMIFSNYFGETINDVNGALQSIRVPFMDKMQEYPYYYSLLQEIDDNAYVFIYCNSQDKVYFSDHNFNRQRMIENGTPIEEARSQSGLCPFSSKPFNMVIVLFGVSQPTAYYCECNTISSTFGDSDQFVGPWVYGYENSVGQALPVLMTNMLYVFHDDDYVSDIPTSCESQNGFDVAPDFDVDENETSLNNLYLDGCNWKFDIPKKFLSSNGKAVFNTSSNLTDYQMLHLDEFYNDYSFTIKTKVRYNEYIGFHSGGGGGHSFGTSANNYKWYENIHNKWMDYQGNFYSNILASANIGLNIPKVDTYTFTYVNPQTNTNYYRQTLEEFYRSGNSCTFWTKDYLFNNCFGVCKVDDNGGTYNCSFANYIYSLNQLYDEFLIEEVTITCNGTIYDIQGTKGGSCTSVYDCVTGSVNVIDDSLNYNNNPFYNNGSDVPLASSNNATSNSGVYNSGNIVINNNPSIVNTNTQNGSGGSGGSDSNFIIKLIKVIFGDKSLENEDSITPDTSGFLNLFGVNRWVQVLNNTFTFVPQSVFTMISIYFGCVLLILLGAFILKIIVEFL